MAWGGPEEQQKECEAGNPHAKDWQHEALQVVEKTMEDYWKDSTTNATCSGPVVPATQPTIPSTELTLQSEFDQHHLRLVQDAGHKDSGGWKVELYHYLEDIPSDMSKHTDVIQWWGDHATTYPILACIVKDICAISASSVSCEQLFSSAGKVAMDHHSRLDPKMFECLQVLKHHWWKTLQDTASIKSAEVGVVLADYEELLAQDVEMAEWEDN